MPCIIKGLFFFEIMMVVNHNGQKSSDYLAFDASSIFPGLLLISIPFPVCGSLNPIPIDYP